MKNDLKDFLNHSIFRRSFGGPLCRQSHPKTARPVSLQHKMQVSLKSSVAIGPRSFLYRHHLKLIRRTLRGLSKKMNVEIFQIQIGYQEIHLTLQTPTRKRLQNFLRAFTGITARQILKAQKASPSKVEKFWDFRPLTNILSEYFDRNWLQKKDLRPYLLMVGFYSSKFENTC